MGKNNRHDFIVVALKDAPGPLSASSLAAKLNVSRQIIVGDIALLRASGLNILATHRGYILNPIKHKHTQQLVFKHTPDQTRLELETLVKHHCHILDVIVEHPTYGDIKGQLDIETMDDVEAFLAGDYPLLSNLTDGLHTHTIAYDDIENLRAAIEELASYHLLYEETQVS